MRFRRIPIGDEKPGEHLDLMGLYKRLVGHGVRPSTALLHCMAYHYPAATGGEIGTVEGCDRLKKIEDLVLAAAEVNAFPDLGVIILAAMDITTKIYKLDRVVVPDEPFKTAEMAGRMKHEDQS
jgi:hypothetical protein